MLFEEDRARHALARVCTDEGATLGTAFFVLAGDRAVALTCNHIVETRDTVLLDCGDGRRRQGVISADDHFPAIDVAIVRCTDAPPPAVLPIEANNLDITRYWTKGFHYYGQDVTDALPASGDISGTTEIQFLTSSGNTYRLSGILVLKNDIFDAGLSGAPVLDPDTGVVFAMVNAKFNRPGPLAGFALPLQNIKEHATALTSLFDANKNTIARYGRFLNHLGAAEICKRQREKMIDRLIRRDLFLRDLYCNRTMESTIDRFFESNYFILPIVGNAGVGKTMLLAEATRRAEGRDIVLLLGRDLHEGETELSAALTSQLREVATQLLGEAGDVSLLVTALRNSKRQLVVFLDGLNEIPASLSGTLSNWIERTITWLEATGSRLVVTSRPEFWEIWKELFPQSFIFREDKTPQPDSAKKEHTMGDFSWDEAEQAKERYGLGKFLSARDVLHPMMARMYWEMLEEGTNVRPVPITRYRALERFIEMKCNRIARALTPSPLRAYVESGLQRVSRTTLQKGGFEVERGEFFQLFADNPNLGNQFVQEGIFTTTRSGFRFTFDEIAEFEQSQIIDLKLLVKRFTEAKEQQPKLTTGTVVFTILRLDEVEDNQQINEAFHAILGAHTRDDDRFFCENIFVQLLSQIRHPKRFVTEIEEMAKQMAHHGYYSFESDRFDLRTTVATIDLPMEFKLDLLRIFLPKEGYYEFESHHWKYLKSDVFSDRYHTATILGEVIQAAPQPAFEYLMSWLVDRTELRGGIATIANVAMALMYYFLHLVPFNWLCELLAKSSHEKAGSLLGIIAKEKPGEILDICLVWVQGDDPFLHDTATWLSFEISSNIKENALENKLYSIFSHLAGLANTEINITAKKGISRLPNYRHIVFDELLNLFQQGAPEIDSYTIAKFASTYFDRVVALVEQLVKAGNNLKKCGELICSLCDRNGTVEETNRIIDLLYLGLDKGLLEFYSFGLGLENLLGHIESELSKQKIADVVRKTIPVSAQARVNIMYFATSKHVDNNYQAELQDELLDLLIIHETDEANIGLLLRLLAADCLERPDPLGYFLKLGEKMSTELFHRRLIGLAFQDERFAAVLATWLASDTRISAAGPTQVFLEKVQQGEVPHKAARRIVLEKDDE
jgi:hypothetical protein